MWIFILITVILISMFELTHAYPYRHFLIRSVSFYAAIIIQTGFGLLLFKIIHNIQPHFAIWLPIDIWPIVAAILYTYIIYLKLPADMAKSLTVTAFLSPGTLIIFPALAQKLLKMSLHEKIQKYANGFANDNTDVSEDVAFRALKNVLLENSGKPWAEKYMYKAFMTMQFADSKQRTMQYLRLLAKVARSKSSADNWLSAVATN